MATTQTSPAMLGAEALPDLQDRGRVIVERVWPEIDGGRFPIKRSVGEQVTVGADIFADGHDLLAGVVKYRPCRSCRGGSSDPPLQWREIPLTPRDNDRWEAAFIVTELGEYEYTIEAWIDRFGTWLKGLVAKADAGQDVANELLEGAQIIQQAAGRLKAAPTYGNVEATYGNVEAGFSRPGATDEGLRLLEIADMLRGASPQVARVWAAKDPSLRALMDARPDRRASTTYERTLICRVDSVRARFGAWYEMFPRSVTTDPSRSGTFREAESRLGGIAAMGFDVVYLPPVHPIGETHRKGRNNSLNAEPGDPGSPWAIGSAAGGHTAIEPGLGTIDDFDRFVRLANRLGLQVALDVAFQASPDHPWVREHPGWFRHRPDGSIKYAENPPKKYQDIYPIDFESAEWEPLWNALKDVFLFWIAHGVRTFRVDNPHTKSFRFWEWVIAEIRRDYPDAIFLAEAFTRPKVMRYLAKAGFNQSYTYFTWRNSAHELRDYLDELTKTELQEYMRPNFFANTPDILHEYLQTGGRPAFEVRLVLAATLAASYGIYSGYELCEHVPARPGSEEYLDSEKYQLRKWDWDRPGHIKELIARVNTIRRRHPALQIDRTLQFHATDNPEIIAYSKTSADGGETIFTIVNLDPHHMQHGHVEIPWMASEESYTVRDLVDDIDYRWRNAWNYVRFDPDIRQGHILWLPKPRT